MPRVKVDGIEVEVSRAAITPRAYGCAGDEAFAGKPMMEAAE